MKIDLLEAHDRYSFLKKQGQSISECCQDMVAKRPFGDLPFYIFAHMRTEDDGISKRLIWQPRLTKPKAQTNSMLFKAYPISDNIKIIWMLPDRSLWDQYKKGNITEMSIVEQSIHDFTHNRQKLEAKEEDDLDDETIDRVYQEISRSAKRLHQTTDLGLVPN